MAAHEIQEYCNSWAFWTNDSGGGAEGENNGRALSLPFSVSLFVYAGGNFVTLLYYHQEPPFPTKKLLRSTYLA